MNDRPKTKLKITATDKGFEIFGWILNLAIWILTLSSYTDLPDTIPIHYNSAGEADRFGAKTHLLALPLIATIIFIGLTILNRFPHIFNYPTNITAENALRQYTLATRLIRYLKNCIVIIFGLIILQTIRNVNGQTDGLGVWFLPLTLGLIFIPLIYYVVKSFQKSQ